MEFSPKPYFDENGKPILEQSVVVFADLLGFKETTHDACLANKQQALLEKLHAALNQAYPNIADPSGTKWSVKIFSDNLIAGYPFRGRGEGAFEFPQACHSIGHFQREMAVEGLFLRGGIAVGLIHISDLIVFGDILRELSLAEKQAVFPRIILLESATHFLQANPDIRDDETLRGIISQCPDWSIINYLHPLRFSCDDGSLRDGMMNQHKRHIEANLKKFKGQCENIYAKYIWVAMYHNSFCQITDRYNNKEFLINVCWSPK